MKTPKQTTWHWPDKVIGKRESRRMREEHNALANEHAELLEALRTLTDWGCTHTSPRDANSPHDILIAARAAIHRAEGRES